MYCQSLDAWSTGFAGLIGGLEVGNVVGAVEGTGAGTVQKIHCGTAHLAETLGDKSEEVGEEQQY